MKTLLIYTDSMSNSGGRERVIANLINEWVKYYKVVLLTKYDDGSFYRYSDKVQYYSLSQKKAEICASKKRVALLFKRIKNLLKI